MARGSGVRGRDKEKVKTRILLTGGCGFLASHLLEYILKNTDWEVEIFDRFSYASGGLQRLKEAGGFDNPRVRTHVVDVSEPVSPCLEKEIGHLDYIVHLAAGTHVDRSIACPREFIRDNVFGTFEILEYARRIPKLKKLIYFSTDEVFGPAEVNQKFKEWDRYNSSSPYSATKAAGEELALAWSNTYGTPVVITHAMNIIGQRQHHEKYVPHIIRSIILRKRLKVHVDLKTGLPGSRNYLHAQDVASAIMFILEHGQIREKYNIAGTRDVNNLDVAFAIRDIMKMPLYYVLADSKTVRPGLDVRYGLDGTKLANMGWSIVRSFEDNIKETVEWAISPKNLHWLHLEDK
jgi:dTDP-glucose 4,6-dehydratase